MFSLSGVGIAFVRDGIIQSANPALSHLIGTTQAVGRAQPHRPVRHRGRHQFRTRRRERAAQSGALASERALRHRRSTPLWAEVALRLVNQNRAEEGFIASFVNVDDRHRAEQNASPCRPTVPEPFWTRCSWAS